jgi:copper chaperone CopZ
MQPYNVDTHDDPVQQLWETRVLGIEGMTSDNCVRQVTRALKRVTGVKNVEVDQAAALVTITFDTTKTDMPMLHDALLASGYRPVAEVESS